MEEKEIRQVLIAAKLHKELQIAKQILNKPIQAIATEAVRKHLKPIQGKVDRVRAEMENVKVEMEKEV